MEGMRSWAGLLAVITALGVVPVSAVPLTGNPAADGWFSHGNSLSMGTYIRGIGGWSFAVYSHEFVLESGDALVNGSTWLVGDQIIGLGGVLAPGQSIMPRLVAKFGAEGATFSASTLASPFGNGRGSFSDGHGGLGSVQVDYAYTFTSSVLDPGQNGVILTPDFVRYYDGTTTLVDADFGRVIALFNGSQLESWEVVLNLRALADPLAGNKGSAIPLVNGLGDMALQPLPLGALPTYTDALTDRTAIPEPSSAILVLSSLVALSRLLKRRRGEACLPPVTDPSRLFRVSR